MKSEVVSDLEGTEDTLQPLQDVLRIELDTKLSQTAADEIRTHLDKGEYREAGAALIKFRGSSGLEAIFILAAFEKWNTGKLDPWPDTPVKRIVTDYRGLPPNPPGAHRHYAQVLVSTDLKANDTPNKQTIRGKFPQNSRAYKAVDAALP